MFAAEPSMRNQSVTKWNRSVVTIGHHALLILAMLLFMQQLRGANLQSEQITVPQMVQPTQGSPPTATGRAMFFTNPAELRDELAIHELLPWLYAGAQIEGYSSYEKHGGPANKDTYLNSISGATRWAPLYGVTGLYEGSYDLHNPDGYTVDEASCVIPGVRQSI